MKSLKDHLHSVIPALLMALGFGGENKNRKDTRDHLPRGQLTERSSRGDRKRLWLIPLRGLHGSWLLFSLDPIVFVEFLCIFFF